jgi:hypothetical protein
MRADDTNDALQFDGGASGFDAADRAWLVVRARGRALAQGAVRGEAGGRVASVFRMTAAVILPGASLAGGWGFGHDAGENSAVNGAGQAPPARQRKATGRSARSEREKRARRFKAQRRLRSAGFVAQAS